MELKKLFKPNAILTKRDSNIVIFGQIALVFIIWNLSNSVLFPRPGEIGTALVDLLVNRGILREFVTSITLCLKAMSIAIFLSMLIAYSSVLPFVRGFANFTTKLRFLPSVGLTFLFMKLSRDIDEQKVMLLSFGITVFFITSIVSIISDIKTDEYNYARTLRFNEWRVTLEVVILGRLAEVFDSIRQNFAIAWMMLAMVENLSKSDGGIGVILADQNKYFKFEYVWAIQTLILLTGIGMDYLLKVIRKFLLPYSALNTVR